MPPGDPIGIAGHHILWPRPKRTHALPVLQKSNLGHLVPGLAPALLQQGRKPHAGYVFLVIGEEVLAALGVQSAQPTFIDCPHGRRLRL